jgi:hypothetical protein
MQSGTMSLTQLRRRKRLTPEQEKRVREEAFAAIRLLYCEALPLWQVCGRGRCRRQRTCAGEKRPCLVRGWPLMTDKLRERAYDAVMAGGPRRRPPATPTERDLRQFPPNNFVNQ